MSSQAKKDAAIQQFRSVTGASHSDSLKYLKASSYRVDVAIDSYFETGGSLPTAGTPQPAASRAPSASNLAAFFDKYKEADDEIGIDGTIKLAADLEIELEDIVMLALAYELKSPAIGEWTRKGWTEGLRGIRVDSLPTLKAALPGLRQKLGSDPDYFYKVYCYAFTFGLQQGQRSLPIDSAVAFWQLLVPFGLSGGALAHVDDLNADPPTSTYPGWRNEHTDWWLEYIQQKNVKGVSKDTWTMFVDFVRTIDDKFEKHDTEGSWPSLIDDFVDYAKEKAAASA